MTRFYWLLACLVLAACAGYAALVLYSASWPAAAGLRPLYNWSPRAYTVAEFWGLRWALAALAAAAGAGALGLTRGPAGRASWHRVLQGAAAAGRGLGAGWRGLRPSQRWLASGLLLGLTLLRGYYSVVNEPLDDAFSYAIFVRSSLLGVSAVYSIPNNHVLSNTVDWLFYQVYPGFWWSMRLPVLLVSTGATVGWFLGLLRRSNFRVALLAVSLFSVMQISFYHAVSGRGYWLLLGLSALGFFALLELVRVDVPVPRQRAAWVALVGSGVLGLYVVPTHAYFLVSAYGWLGVVWWRRGAWGALGRAVGLGALTLVGAGLLYAPLLLISGPRLLLENKYVRTLSAGEFWGSLPAYLWSTEGTLAGHRFLGLGPVVLVLVGFALLWRRARMGRLPGPLARIVQELGVVSAWFVVAPYGLVLAQRVQPPERTLFYKSQLLFVLVGLGADWVLRQARTPAARHRLRAVVVVGGLAYAVGGLWLVQRFNGFRLGAWPLHRAAVAWLATQPVGPVLASDEGWFNFLLRFYAYSEYRGRPWQIDSHPQPGVHYRYLVSKPGAHDVPEGPPVAGPPAYHGTMDIFVAL